MSLLVEKIREKNLSFYLLLSLSLPAQIAGLPTFTNSIKTYMFYVLLTEDVVSDLASKSDKLI